MFPGSVSLRLCAADFSEEAKRYNESKKESSLIGELFGDAGLPFLLAPTFAAPPSLEPAVTVSPNKISSLKAVELRTLNLVKDGPDDALLDKVPFKIELKSDRYITALVLYMEASLDSDADLISAAPAEPVSSNSSACAQNGMRQMVFHMPAVEPGHEKKSLLLHGSEFPVVEGSISTRWSSVGDCIEVDIDMSARHRGKGPLPRSAAIFSLET